MEGDYVHFARDDISVAEKLSLRWHGWRRVIGALKDYVYQVEDLRNGFLEDYYGFHLMFYHDLSLNTEAFLSHAVSSETGMPVQCLMRVLGSAVGLMIQVH